jgi:hypothetical protein
VHVNELFIVNKSTVRNTWFDRERSVTSEKRMVMRMYIRRLKYNSC